MTDELIKKINELCPYEQGIFREPYGIPTKIKEPVIYTRWETGGVSGGHYGGDSNPKPFTKQPPNDRFKVLDLLLMEVCPDISYLQYKLLEILWDENNYSEDYYYGNSTDYEIRFIPVSVFEEFIAKIKK